MVSKIVKTSALVAGMVLSGAAYAQQTEAPMNDQRGPVATDPSENGQPGANPTDRGGPAVKRSQERGEVPPQRPRNRMNDE